MKQPSATLRSDADLNEAAELLDKNPMVLITEDDKFMGLVTRIDLLNYFILRAQGK
jgi:predicted transcriptional regulator